VKVVPNLASKVRLPSHGRVQAANRVYNMCGRLGTLGLVV
jgi:hypothetical protein